MLVAEEENVELKALIERYEQLLYDWEELSDRMLTILGDRSNFTNERRDALYHL